MGAIQNRGQTGMAASCETSRQVSVSTLPQAQQIGLMKSLFLAFGSTWGPKWTDHLAGLDVTAMAADWAEDLGGLTQDQITAKLKICRRTLAWPPCPAELIAAGDPRPRTQAEWMSWGSREGIQARPGELTDAYVARLQRARA
jgi:hypothetical protein